MRGESTEQYEVALERRLERDNNYLEQSVERVTDVNATIVERINEIKARSEEYVQIVVHAFCWLLDCSLTHT